MANEPISQYPQLPPDEPTGSWLAQNRRFVILGGGVLVLAVIIVILTRIRSGATNQTTNSTNQSNASTTTTNSTAQAPVFHRYTVTTPADQDHDGLSDSQEEQLGTNPAQADTDGDGLSDYDEVKIYHTDPRKPDTDGDGVSDGQEVHQGTNPTGGGSLLNINHALQKLTNK